MELNHTYLYPTDNIEQYMANICSPNFCTIESSCQAVSDPFSSTMSISLDLQGCCGGIAEKQRCEPVLYSVGTCAGQAVCTPDIDPSSNESRCVVPTKASTTWIGIILNLISATTTNIGLNLQKLALRKRHEKVVRKKERETVGLVYHLASLRSSVKTFYRNLSNASLSNRSGAQSLEISTPAEIPMESLSRDHSIRQHGETRVKKVQSFPTADKDKAEFQKDLRMGNLFRNPRWLLGMVVFIFGNICNFLALNFAAQSLLAPISSISLVVNVIVAPLINHEIWTYNDLVGIFLIVSGSVVVVVFAGSPGKDYDVCVLLKLFQQTPTIVYLSVVASLITTVFIGICIVEKNLDLKDSSDEVLKKAIQGDLVAVETKPAKPSRHTPEIVVSDEEMEGGEAIKRIVTISTPVRADQDSSDEDYLSRDETSSIDNESGIEMIVDGNNEKIDTILKSKPGDRTSVHSVSLTFKIKKPNDNTETSPVDSLKPPSPIKNEINPDEISATNSASDISQNASNPIIPDGLMGTLTVLFANATIHLLSTSIFGSQNQFNSFSAWLFTFITLSTAVAQVYWINMGLARYDALIQIPVYFVVWTIFDVVGGGVYYNEFANYTTTRFVLFIFGIVIIFVGVIVLAGRLKTLEVDSMDPITPSESEKNEV
ncbi:NIPA-like protein 3 [Terramyces sp. JEL0728]|nr:NIPA-like protein 3 [Terramyces sp. JEL0728]